MEDLLNKNIFVDKDLYKLSPDYSPRNILLRMEMRRTMVKDTHTHKSKTNDLERKLIKRGKECRTEHKINKEVVKLRKGFQKTNLKNQIILKNAMKYVEKAKIKELAAYCEDDDLLLNQTELNEICEHRDSLIICNDNDFKINPKVNKVNPQTTKPKATNQINDDNLDTTNYSSFEDVFRVQCKYVTPELPEFDTSESGNHEFNITQDKDELESDVDITPSAISIGNKDNLQSLLIMMAITSQTNEDEYEDNQSKETEVTLNNEDIQQNSMSSNTVQCTDFLTVMPLRIDINDRQQNIMKKYVEKWKTFLKKKRDFIAHQRQNTINRFFDKLAKKQKSVLKESTDLKRNKLQDYNTYQHRYKVQTHIIALQRAKIEEQNKMIEELKYNKIVEASRQSVDAMREEVRKTYYEIDRHLKPKIKCLTNELKIQEIEEPSLVLHCLKVPQFIQRMEKRAREREEKHAVIRERRRQMEEKRIRLKQQAELSRAEMDKEEKIKRMKELKEKRKREKIESIRRKQYAQRMRALIVMADLHYEKNLMAKYGIRPLRLLIEIKKDNTEKATAHYKFQLKNSIFLHWLWFTEDTWIERNFKAENCFRRNVLCKVLDCFKKNHHEYVLKRQVAEDYYDLYITQLMFKKFCEGLVLVRKENEFKWQKVVKYHNRALPALNALKREQEARKARWREKVIQVVPDYTPPED